MDDERSSGARLLAPARGAVIALGDPYAQVLALDERTPLARIVGALAFTGLAVEVHILIRLWVAMLDRAAGLLDHLPPGIMAVFLRVLLVGATGVLGIFGLASLGFRGGREARRVFATLGAVVGVSVVMSVAAFVLAPDLSRVWQGEVLLLGRAVAAGAFAGVVTYGVLTAIDHWSRSTRFAIAATIAVFTMIPIGVLSHLDLNWGSKEPEAMPIDVDLIEPPPEPTPPPTAEPDQPAPEPPKAAAATPPPAAAPAQAAKVVAVNPDPSKPLDFTDTIIQGNANDYAGGITTSDGTGATAVRNVAASSGGVVPNGVGNAPGAPPPPQVQAVSHARPAGLMSHDWRCPFPPEADTAQIDEAVVMLEITVRPDGTPGAVRILRDPGNGFGRMAYQCAMRQRFVTALDPEGNSMQGLVRAPVHFNR